MTIRNVHSDPTKVILNIQAVTAGETGGGTLELEYGIQADIPMPDGLFSDVGGASVSSTDQEDEGVDQSSVAQMRSRIEELEDKVDSYESAGSAQPSEDADDSGLNSAIKNSIEKTIGDLKVVQVEDIQKNFDAEAEGNKAQKVEAVLARYDELSGEGKAKLFAEVQRCKGAK